MNNFPPLIYWDFNIVESKAYKISELEIRVENQEQYSRRTSLRFHNIKVPVDQRGNIIHPVDTDDLVLQVCNTKLGLDISKTDIGRSHVIGKVNKGKSQVLFSMSSKFVVNCFLLVSSFFHIYSAIRCPVSVYLTMEFELGKSFH
jgi:hypothetical protein